MSSQKSQYSNNFVNFTTSGVGGILGWIVIHPFNTLSVRMNLASAAADGGSKLSFTNFATNEIKLKGVLNLYSGLSAGILRQTFYATTRFGLFEVFRDELAKFRNTDIFSRLVTGMASGGIAALISCPAEVCLVRLSNDSTLPLDQRRNYKGVTDAFYRILKEEGPKTFLSGSSPFIKRAMVVGAVQVGTYDQFRETFRNWGITDAKLNVFCASMTSGIIYSIITMPLEASKNRMAFQKICKTTGQFPYRTTIQTIQTVVAKEGFRALYNGFLPYYLRCGGHTVFMFMSVEWLRQLVKR